MSKLKLILVRLCLVMGSIFMGSIFIGANMYSNAFAGQVATASFDMEANGIAYRIFTAAPSEAAPQGGYPVVYMTDGNRMLPIAAKLMAENSSLKAVFVGIGYPSGDKDEIVRLRYFDLTPPTPADQIPTKGETPKTGGRDAFFDFIEKRVKPEIEKRFSIDRNRQSLFGHSLGGLFTLYALFNHPDSYQAYSAADPSIWWNGRSILTDKDRFVTAFKADPKPMRLLIENSGKRTVHQDMTQEDMKRVNALRGGPSGDELYEELSGLPRFETAYRRFENENHGSMIPLTVADSLNFLLLGQAPQLKKN